MPIVETKAKSVSKRQILGKLKDGGTGQTIKIDGLNQIKVSAEDAHSNYLANKIVTERGLTETVVDDSGVEQLYIGMPEANANGDILKYDDTSGLWVASNLGAIEISADTTNFDKILSSSDDTIQKALDTIDDHTHNGLLPNGTDGQTLRNNSGTWEASSLLQNDGSALFIDGGDGDHYIQIEPLDNDGTDDLARETISGLNKAQLLITAISGDGEVTLTAKMDGATDVSTIYLSSLTADTPLKADASKCIVSGAFGTGSGEFAEGNHTHTGLLPSGTDEQTLRNNSGTWEADDTLLNDGTDLYFNIANKAIGNIVRCSNANGKIEWTPPNMIGVPQATYKTADESVTNSTTYQNDDHLSFSVASNGKYIVNINLMITQADAGSSFKFKFTVPSGCVCRGSYNMFLGTGISTGVLSGVDMDLTSSQDLFMGSASNYLIQINMMVDNSSTQGTVQLQWAQLYANNYATTLKKYSNMIINKIV